MTTRRRFLELFAGVTASIIGPTAGLKPSPKAPFRLPAIDAYAAEHVMPQLAENIYKTSPVFARLNGISEWNDVTGGDQNGISRGVWNGNAAV